MIEGDNKLSFLNLADQTTILLAMFLPQGSCNEDTDHADDHKESNQETSL